MKKQLKMVILACMLVVTTIGSLCGCTSTNTWNEAQSIMQEDYHKTDAVTVDATESSGETGDATENSEGTKTDDTDLVDGTETEGTELADPTEDTKPDTQQTIETTEEISLETEPSQAVTYSFRKERYLTEHFEKHGNEFDYANAEEYLQGANRVIADPNALHKTEKEDGDFVYYLEESNEFVILSKDGYIRTYFKPSAGISYYNRQ